MNPITLDALQLVHDHEAVMALLAEALTPEQRATLESLDELLSALRNRVLAGEPWAYQATRLEEARALDQVRMAEEGTA